MNSSRLRCLGIFSLSLLVLAQANGFQKPAREELPNFDKRARQAEEALHQHHADAEKKLREKLPKAQLNFDEITGSPKLVSAQDGFLSGKNASGRGISANVSADFPANEPHRATKAFLKEHRGLFGHGPEALAAAKIKRDFITPHNGLRTVVWEQQLGGISVFDGLLTSHTTKAEELIRISDYFVPDPALAARSALANRAARNGAEKISAENAVALAAANIGEKIQVGEVALLEALGDAEKKKKFKTPPLNGEAETRLVWLPMNVKEMRLCWEVVLTSRARGEGFRVLVDADSGEVLVRRGLTEYLSNASYRVFTSDSPSPFSPGHPTPLSTQPSVVSRSLIVTNAFDTNASPAGWIDDAVNETRGNNVDAHLDRNNDNLPDLPRPQGSPSRVFDFPIDFTQAPTSYSNASVVQLFFLSNWYHDKLYALGFTEAAGNFQIDNFGRGGFGNDAVAADAQDGGGFNNANFSTPSDGSPGRMQMYIFSGPTPDRDGSLDGEIVFHELTHGLSNRRVGGGVGMSELQSRGMGEGWSDFYGASLLAEPGDNVNGNYAVGGYATFQLSGLTENYYYGIRRYPYSMDLAKNPLTFKDIDPTQASSHPGIPISPIFTALAADEVHAQGEVWCVALWEARANLIAKYGSVAGNQLMLQLVTDGMNFSPANPNFLEARDAILQADIVNNGGTNLSELWAGFAKRGLGASATSPASSTTTGVVESFQVPDSLVITPQTGVIANGPVGGPFVPNSQIFSLTNDSAAAITWNLGTSSNWLTASPTSGTLTPGGAATAVTVNLNATANTLPTGIYTEAVQFTNLTSGIVQTRQFTLRVGQPTVFFTEFFENFDNDLDNRMFTFTPDGSANFYSVCRQAVSSFPTDPTGGTNIVGGAWSQFPPDDAFAIITLPATNRVKIYGSSNNVFYIGSNGYITLGSSDTTFSPSLSAHFNRARISGLFLDLLPTNSTSVSWKQMSNRVAVTFLNVPQFSTLNTNSFQIEMFFDGMIRLTYLRIDATGGLAGLARGTGTPVGFVESDFSAFGICPQIFSITRAFLNPSKTLTLEFNTSSNVIYNVQYSDNLIGWTNAVPSISGTGSSVQWPDNTSTPPTSRRARFFRVVSTP